MKIEDNLQQQIEDRIIKNGYCCFDCGRKYLTAAQMEKEDVVTAHKGICVVCQKENAVTHIRAFNWLRKNYSHSK